MKREDFKEITKEHIEVVKRIQQQHNCTNIGCDECPFFEDSLNINISPDACYVESEELYYISLDETIKQFLDIFDQPQSTTNDLKTSGGRKQFSTGMVRDIDDNKPRFDLISPLDIPYDEQILTRWAKHMAKGAKHYSERNWELSATKEEYYGFRKSALRHFMQWFYGQEDEDHAVAVMFNITGAERLKYKGVLND